jgi:hypothetical protein
VSSPARIAKQPKARVDTGNLSGIFCRDCRQQTPGLPVCQSLYEASTKRAVTMTKRAFGNGLGVRETPDIRSLNGFTLTEQGYRNYQ